MRPITLLLGFAATVTSCTHLYYAPNTANAPLLSEKGETRINGLISGGGESEFSGGELQAAHAITNSFGIIANWIAASKSEEISSFDWIRPGPVHTEKGKGSYVEFAGGYFKTLDKRKRVVFETYGGIGFGGVNNDYGFGNVSKVNITKLFLQPSLGYKSNYFEVAFVPKISFVNWTVKENSLSASANSYDKQALATIESKPHFVAIEPALLLRGGFKNVKLQGSLSFSNVSSDPNHQLGDLIEGLNMSFGISVNFKAVTK
jgi:hypothetical protein